MNIVPSAIAFLAIAHGWMVRKCGRSDAGSRRFRFPAIVVLAVLSAVASAMLIAMGNVEGAAGDIGGRGLWLLSTAGLFGLSLAGIDSGERRMASPSARDV